MLGNRMAQHQLAQRPDVRRPRSTFDRSFPLKTTFDFDYLVPVYREEIIPGDTINLSVNAFARLTTQIVPIMDNLMIDFFFFFTPNRLVWENWEKFCGAQTDPGDSTDYICPQMTFGAGAPPVQPAGATGNLGFYDQMGCPTEIAAGYTIKNCLPFRGYNLIWNEWFRDQNLQDSIPVPKDDGPDVPLDYGLLKRGKRHDYFTSCLPWPQKGIAVGAPVIGIGKFNQTFANGPLTFYESDGATATYSKYQYIDPTSADESFAIEGTDAAGYPNIRVDINDLREAWAMQDLFELDARGGTRYVEILLAHYNVVSPDFRLQRPEFLGSGQMRINVHPVAQTSPTAGSDPQGQLAAFSTASTSGGIGFSKSFVEHGYVLGLACARSEVTYQQGLDKMYDRSTRYDFYWPGLSQLGEQAVLNKEIYLQGTSDDELVFGYQERYAEYRYRNAEIHGQFRSTYAQTLDYWHMAQEFSALPTLNTTFIQSDTPIERALAAPSEIQIYLDAFFKVTHARPMSTYSTPASLGRF